MSLGASRYFTLRQLRALDKLGNIMIPANSAFPAFSDLGCREHVDVTLTNAHADDIKALQILLTVLAFLPPVIISGILKIAAWGAKFTGIVGVPFRLINTSLRGLIFSLYYSNLTRCSYQGATAYTAIDFTLHCEPDTDFKQKP